MLERTNYIFASLLVHGCIEETCGAFECTAVHKGGCTELYGLINAGDSLAAIKKLVFDEQKYTLQQLNDAMITNYHNCEPLRLDLLEAPKYGNDNDYVDSIVIKLHAYAIDTLKQEGIKCGLDSYGPVIINNNTNTKWGRYTAASCDGRYRGQSMAPGNNPQSGADTNGPTAMLNSILKMRSDHYGNVHNLKLSKKMLSTTNSPGRMLIDTYFKNGGTQLMISCVSQQDLLQARLNPESHRDIIVRVGGYSAIFVDEEADVQQEIIERTIY